VNPEALLAAVDAALAHDRGARQRQAHQSALLGRFGRLTPREQQVFPLVISGFLNKQAAAELSISEVTLQVHRGRIMRKMAAHSFAELVRMGSVLGIRGDLRPRRASAYQSCNSAVLLQSILSTFGWMNAATRWWRLLGVAAGRGRYQGAKGRNVLLEICGEAMAASQISRLVVRYPRAAARILPRQYLERQIDRHRGCSRDQRRSGFGIAKYHEPSRAQRESRSRGIAAEINASEYCESTLSCEGVHAL
jgi:DNA-binding CsgD family transcriptional regulator